MLGSRFGEYELFDLVVLDQQTVGVVVAIDKDTCRVLTNQVCLLRSRPTAHDIHQTE